MIKKYRVKSDTEPNKFYIVQHFEQSGKYVCLEEATGKPCPSYAFGGVGFECKHIQKVKQHLNQKQEPPLPEELPETKFVIKTKKQYKETKIKVAKLSKEIGDSKDKKSKDKKIDEHQKLAEAMLSYETENNLIPI